MNFFSDKKHFWWTAGCTWLISIGIIISVHFYNQYLDREYLHGKGLDIISTFSILSDPTYITFLILGLVSVLALLFIAGIPIVMALKNSGELVDYKYVLIFGPIVSLAVLIILVYEYASLIFLVFAIGSIIIGAIFLIINDQ
ncbi:hypothetical protein [Limosilactobacillus antri]|uniref:hypothetical protein n=1 Tax=Limosilactobacillus antri TaxID=227943 RepID=UPI001F56DB0F|nr:hypothetical protein [Limosilactobacillus antri]